VREDIRRLEDILQAIEKIEKYQQQGRESFEEDELLQVWIIHHLEIIGEATANLSKEIRAGYPNVPWPQIVGMRNILIHRYFGIDLGLVWQSIERDLPTLKTNVTTALGKLRGND